MIQTLSSRLQSAGVSQHEFHLFSLIFLASYILLCILKYSWCYRISGLPEACHNKSHFWAPPQRWTTLHLDHKPTGNQNGIIHFLVSRERWEHFCHQFNFITATFHCLPVSLIIFSLNKMRIILPFSEEIFLIYIGVREHFEKSNYRSYFTVLCCWEMTVQPK